MDIGLAAVRQAFAGGDIKDHLPGWYRESDEEMIGVLRNIIDRQEEVEPDHVREPLKEGEL